MRRTGLRESKGTEVVITKAEILYSLFTEFSGPVRFQTSVITIHKSWPNPEQPCVYVVSAESHTRFIYPNDKLNLAIERFMYLFGNKEGYKHENHLQYKDLEEQ